MFWSWLFYSIIVDETESVLKKYISRSEKSNIFHTSSNASRASGRD